MRRETDMRITPKELAGYFDHTQLKAYAVRADFEKLCRETMRVCR